MKIARDSRCIQFIGTQRSGSNLLRVMLNQLPEISAPHPPHILKTFYPLINDFYDLNSQESFRQLIIDVCDWVNNNPVPWDDCILIPEVIEEQCIRNSLIEIFRVIYELKACVDAAKFWCCKSMENIYYINQIESEGINPIYIHIYRDGRDVATSFLKAIVGEKHVYFLAKKWVEEQKLSLEVRNRITENRFISISYENLITNPDKELKAICLQLDLPMQQSVFEYFTSFESIKAADSGQMWQNLNRPIIENNFNKFERELTKDELLIFESVAYDMLLQLNYKPLFKRSDLIKNFELDKIQSFKQESEERKRIIIKSSNDTELQKRSNQEQILKSIKSRRTLSL